MLHANNEKQKKRIDRRNRTTKSRKKHSEKKETYNYLGSRHYQTSGAERKNLKTYLKRMRKLLKTKL